ncbi:MULTISPECIES: LamB/YcsF family protein [unclassified Nocardioides]|uniref:LamB/YcsF family protein n=1 Tax=unclassified Nocardioides TaxID=2615069 RepID=UPI0009F13592|nr:MULTISPECIES: 5-oxoprolinase subunit PxpA [unclassified Nocardioides]GAW49105.1 LamB/YcsF family protein [Nocardioides sp. PD653-B2]GAW56736.1 LamB/YcsF family protein [Nocardioides sp. PD653]
MTAAPLTVDLNCDLGESFGAWRLGDDAAMLSLVSSANVACGFHAGDPTVIRQTVATAAAEDVAIGAHVAYPDLAGFGRRFMDMSPESLADAVLYQIAALEGFARAAGRRVAYVKPHGALYNTVVHHVDQARAVVRATKTFDPSLKILGLPGSAVLAAAREEGLGVVTEAFADRAYTPEGTLVSRSEPGAVLADVEHVARRATRMVTHREVEAIDGSVIRIDADSLCIHGDSPGAVEMAHAVRAGLTGAGVEIRAFAR